MEEGCVVNKTIEIRPLGKLQVELAGQEAEDGVGTFAGITCPKNELGSIAGREDHHFVDTFRSNQLLQNLKPLKLWKPKALTDVDGGGPEVQSDDDESGIHRNLHQGLLWLGTRVTKPPGLRHKPGVQCFQ